MKKVLSVIIVFAALTTLGACGGKVEKADTIVDINDGVALDLIKRGIAQKLSKPKASK